MLLYTFSLEMLSPQTTCGMYYPAQLQKYKYFTPRGHKVYPSDSTSSEIQERAEKQITVCWTENYTELLTTVYPTGFPMGLCLQYFKNKTELSGGKKEKHVSLLPSSRQKLLTWSNALVLWFPWGEPFRGLSDFSSHWKEAQERNKCLWGSSDKQNAT